MLDCKLCNYCNTIDSNSKGVKVCMCELTGFIFNKRISDYEMEYPCSNVDFERIEMVYDELKLA